MKFAKWFCAGLLAMVFLPNAARAVDSEGLKFLQLNNRVRFEYDDNIYQTKNDKIDSFKILEEVEMLLNFNLENTYVSLRYRPTFTWWQEKYEGKNTEFDNDFDFVLNQTFSPRLSLSIVDTLRYGKAVVASDHGDTVISTNSDFYYNTLNGTVSYLLQPDTRLDVAGRWAGVWYQQSDVAETENFNDYVGGLTLRQQLTAKTAVFAEGRLETIRYEKDVYGDRNSKTYYLGVGADQTFNPKLVGSIDGGYQHKDFTDSSLTSENAPYGEASITFLPSPATRITAGGGYSMYESEAFPYANQNRAQIYGSLAHDLTARISLYLTGSYIDSQYKADQAVKTAYGVRDGSEDAVQVSARATYKVNRSNWLEAGWEFTDLSSGLKTDAGASIRDSYDENRVDVGWKTSF